NVHTALAPRRFEFSSEAFCRRSRRHAVERHVNYASHAARRSRARRRREALPLRPPRLVYVHVRVNESRHKDRVARFLDAHARRHFFERTERDDAPTADVNRGGADPIRRYDELTSDDEIRQRHRANLKHGSHFLSSASRKRTSKVLR